jgi:hypothetical protein
VGTLTPITGSLFRNCDNAIFSGLWPEDGATYRVVLTLERVEHFEDEKAR